MIQRQAYSSEHPLKTYLIHEGILTEPIAELALKNSYEQKLPLLSYLAINNLINCNKLMYQLAKSFNFDIFDLDNFDKNWLSNINLSPTLIRQCHLVPLCSIDQIPTIGLSDPTDKSMIETISFHLNVTPHIRVVAEDKLYQLLQTHYNQNQFDNSLKYQLINQLSHENNSLTIEESSVTYDEPLITFTDNILKHAIYQNASDIHIEPANPNCRIRYRQDGILHETSTLPLQLFTRLTTRLKVIANLDIAERRLPQDGRFQFDEHDIRISTCPTLHGEKLVLRILKTNNLIHTLSSLGLSTSQYKMLINILAQPQGMILVTGPTGSGKTITLYSALNYLNSSSKNISTVEDPIEIQLNGINQVNIHPKIGLQFSTVLRTLLRQDPDIIMVGEIRDSETAKIAIQAAQTGHLVLSSLHTNSAMDALTRLKSIGIEEYNISSSISLIISQRLVRKLCEFCKIKDNITIKTLNIEIAYKAVGCSKCLLGYKGRTAIYELLPVTPDIIKNTPRKARLPTNTSLQHSGYLKIKNGITSLSELNRVL